MCQTLDDLRQAIHSYASRFDAARLTPAQAGMVVGLCARMEASLANMRALAAARAAEGHGWKEQGYRSAAEQLARQSGTTTASARRLLESGRRMRDLPSVAEAALAGRLSAEQAAAIADVAVAAPQHTAALIAEAHHSSLHELNERAALVRATSGGSDPEAERARRHRRRNLRHWTDRQGGSHLHMYGHPEDVAHVMAAIDPIKRHLNHVRRQEQVNDPFEALDYDALVALARLARGTGTDLTVEQAVSLGVFPQLGQGAGAAGARSGGKQLAGSPAKITIRVDLDTLLRGVPLDGELCEIVGYGPIPVSVIEEIIANDNPFIAAVLTRSQEIVGVYHSRRRPNATQRTALDFLHSRCAAQGCNSKTRLQYDHREDYSRTGYTVYDLLDRLCPHHHRLKTRGNWALVPGRGIRPFVPPTDPRHPGQRRSVTPAPPEGAPTDPRHPGQPRSVTPPPPEGALSRVGPPAGQVLTVDGTSTSFSPDPPP